MILERTILVVDDDPDIRETLADALRSEGYETRTASEGGEALVILDALRGAPCILVLDLTMPKMNGFEVLDVLSNLGRLDDVPVIVCSAIEPPAELPPGIRLFLTKPVDLHELLRGIRDLCRAEPPRRLRKGRRRILEMG